MPSLFRDVSLEQLDTTEHLDHLLQVTTPRKWLLLVGFVLVFAAIAAWAVWGEITATVTASGWVMEASADANGDVQPEAARLFLESDEVIRTGMSVRLEPKGYSREHHGYLLGTVTAVEVVTTASLAQKGWLDRLPQALRSAPSLLALTVQFKASPDQPGQPQWTLSHTPAPRPMADTPVSGVIILSQQQPLSMILKNASGGEGQ